MSDPVAEPGAPSSGVTELPPAQEKSIATETKKRAPTLARLAATPDRVILRLNKLLASPGGLSAFLSTFNYTLYLLAYLETKSTPLRIRLYQLLNRTSSVPALNTEPSHIAALGSLLSSTRTTLRLFGLFPMYAWLRQLSQGPKPGQDQVLYATAVTQAVLYTTFQFLENVAVLTDHKILPAAYTARWTAASGGKTAKIYLWSYRAWMGGVLCDFVRLFREAQLERVKRSQRAQSQGGSEVSVKEDEEVDRKWYAQMVVPLSWLPVAAQFSLESGIPGFNLGIMGACGALAGLGRTADLWASTAE
ncbi:hypothetical protein BAUCODRAFT_78596 [Baudoinia panamericana UAMH 10762]|uniref:Uncharacterized protein n=1 Tax=Baudoinia panamericana (strain UAMH 10762) TaxID=717646 RepID=M2MZM5_BAUPA|nr:uncharacterized protein BAUCODRAFT_78596 [Baudoinia panamericana UAMH 10762]EMC92119.1 hypothetical protein BAUCODRAFT_78596 [Baudoinia panamericana UAMH 10762]